eukprot:gene17532-23094_t
MSTIAVVTGSNKGIGFEIVKKLSSIGYKTILATRNVDLGSKAASSLRSQGLDVEFRELDISSDESIKAFVSKFQSDYGKCDVLVNNAAIAFKGSDPTPFKLQAEPTIKTNYFGTLSLTTLMLPLLQNSSSPRIVNVASQAGLLGILPSNDRKKFFTSETLTVDDLSEALNQFVVDVKNEKHKENGWPNSCYGISKLGVIALTKVLARNYPNIIINACCPGYCKTDMSSHGGNRSAEEGARTPFYLSTLTTGSVTGKFFYDEKEIVW